MIGIYKITSPSGKIYIGSSKNIKRRLWYYSSLNCVGQVKMYNSIKKHGWGNHIVEILEECSFELLYERELFYANMYDVLSDNGLNCVIPLLGEKKQGVSDKTKLKMSESKKGNKNYFFGKKHNKEAREKISKAQLGRKHTLEHRLKVSLNSSRYKSKVVLNLNDGMFYNSCLEASIAYGFNYSTLRSQLNGTNKNSSSMIFV